MYCRHHRRRLFLSLGLYTPDPGVGPLGLYTPDPSVRPKPTTVTNTVTNTALPEIRDDNSHEPKSKKQKTEPKTVMETTLQVTKESDAVNFVQEKIDSGKWRLERAQSARIGYSHSICPMPTYYYTMDFVVAGTERSTYKNRQIIKAAGYNHFSGCAYAGWQPFPLENNEKAFGKEVSVSQTPP